MTEARKQQEIAYRKNLIIDAAKIVFYDKGFENSTVEDIANQAGYSKGSIYSYFNSKNEICFTIVNDYLSKIVNMVQDISNKNTNGRDKLVMIKDAFIEDYAQNSHFCSIYETFKYHRSQCTEVEDEISINEKYNNRIRQLITAMVRLGIEDGSINSTVDVEKLSRAFWNEKNCFLAETMFKDENSYDYLFDLIIDSIETPEGV